MESIEDILAVCIEDIKEGRHTLANCLAIYPDKRQQLEPLLKIALSIKEPPSFRPTKDFKIKARVQLMEYIHDSRSKKTSWNPWEIFYLREFHFHFRQPFVSSPFWKKKQKV